jgi:hypothetical protein
LRAFRALDYFKFDGITFLQRAVTIADDRGIVDEHIGTVFTANESVSFRIIEPLHCTLHFVSPLAGDSNVSYSWGGKHTDRRHEHELRGVYQIAYGSQWKKAEKFRPLCVICRYKPIKSTFLVGKPTAKK